MVSRIAFASTALVFLAGACGQAVSPSEDDAVEPRAVPTAVAGDGVYRIGVDLAAGLYTAGPASCVAYSAPEAEATPERLGDYPEDAIQVATVVGDVLRINLSPGAFLHTSGCSSWRRVLDDEAAPPDPGTEDGACQILMGEDLLLENVLNTAMNPSATAAERQALQERLLPIVASQVPGIWEPVGALVDELDNPGGSRDGLLRDAALIRDVCDKS